MKQPRSFPARFAAAALLAGFIMLLVPTAAHLVLGGPVSTPLAWSAVSLVGTALAAVAGVAVLAWRPPSVWNTLLAAVVAAGTTTVAPMLLWWNDRDAWPMLVFYLTFYGVYVAAFPALFAAAAVLHGRKEARAEGTLRTA